MNRLDPSRLAPPITEARLARLFEGVPRRVGQVRRRRRVWRVLGAAATAALAVTCLLVLRGHIPGSHVQLVEGTLLEADPSASAVRVTLADGSSVQLEAGTRARLTAAQPTSVRIDVDHGGIEVEVAHADGRAFVVGAGAYEVRVTGTHFHVHRAPGDRVTVSVDRGTVRIVSPLTDASTVGAGQEWSAPDLGSAASAAAAPSSEPAPAGASPVSAAPGVPLPHAESARDLFDIAQRARAEGKPQDAARAFDRIRRRYRSDPRAPLAAFELGRLRLDSLDDPAGAEEALRDAILLGPQAQFLEDAEARRVEALSRMGDSAGCKRAREEYLATWPLGMHRHAVQMHCRE